MNVSAFRKVFMFAVSLLTRADRKLPFFKLYTCISHILGLENVQLFVIKGLVKDTNCSATTLFVGDETSAYYFAYLGYSHIKKLFSLGKFLFRQVDPSGLTDVDVIVVDARAHRVSKFLKQGYLLLPQVSFSLDLGRPVCDIIKRSSRRRRRSIKELNRFNYSYAISRNNEKNFDFYYWKMYLPYTRKRFGMCAFTLSYSRLKALYRRNGGIIFVLKGKKPLAGMLFRTNGKTLYALNLGAYEGDQNYLRDLACQAALFFLIEWAKMKGIKSLNYGLTVPFLANGNFQYKKEWGMFMDEVAGKPFCALKINSLNGSSLSFLHQNPFIFLDAGVPKGVIFLDHRPSEKELQKIFSMYLFPKLDSLIVIGYYNHNTGAANETDFPIESQNMPDVLGKGLSHVYSSLRKRGFTVEVFVRERIKFCAPTFGYS